jgi:hypothetical protein
MNLSRDLRKQLPERLTLEEFVHSARVGFPQQIVTFLLRAYGVLLAATMAIFFLQGFHLAGFSLDAAILNWLGGATIGEIGDLLVLTVRASFK